MQTVFVQANEENVPLNHNFYIAYEGFRQRGQNVRLFALEPIDAVTQGLSDVVACSREHDVVVVATIPVFLAALDALNVPHPPVVDYPDCLRQFLGRNVWETTLDEVRSKDSIWPVFIKPSRIGKAFTGHLVSRFADLIETNTFDDTFPIWASQPMTFETEWRVFVLEGRILDLRLYKGSRWFAPIRGEVLAMIDQFEASGTAPVAYAIDVGLSFTASGDPQMRLVEVNDGRSLGTYGLEPTYYAQMLEARWKQIVST